MTRQKKLRGKEWPALDSFSGGWINCWYSATVDTRELIVHPQLTSVKQYEKTLATNPEMLELITDRIAFLLGGHHPSPFDELEDIGLFLWWEESVLLSAVGYDQDADKCRAQYLASNKLRRTIDRFFQPFVDYWKERGKLLSTDYAETEVEAVEKDGADTFDDQYATSPLAYARKIHASQKRLAEQVPESAGKVQDLCGTLLETSSSHLHSYYRLLLQKFETYEGRVNSLKLQNELDS